MLLCHFKFSFKEDKLNFRFIGTLNDINYSPYGYLLFDNCINSPNNARVRTNIFPFEETIVYDVQINKINFL